MIIEKHSVPLCVAFACICGLAACVTDTSDPNGHGSGGAPGAAGAGVAGAGIAGSGLAGSAGAPSTGAAGAGSAGAPAAGAPGAGGVSGSAGAPAAGGSGGSTTTDPGSEGDGLRTLPQPFKTAADTLKQDGVPHGKIISFTFAKGASLRYPKAPARAVKVYVPAQYVTGTPAPVMVVQDGDQNNYGFVDLLSNTIDNLVAAKKLPPIVAVFANNGGGDAQGSERGLEYDTLSGVYGEWVDQELLPRAEQETKSQLAAQAVTFTKDPQGRCGMGGSSGGIASFIMAWYHPELFARALTFSPSFVAQESPSNPAHPLGAWNFHEDKDEDEGGIIAKTDPIKPIRVWMEAGTNDLNGGTEYPHYDLEYGARRSEMKMAAKGYHVHLDIGTNAAHVDGNVVRQTMPEAMLWVWRGYMGAQ